MCMQSGKKGENGKKLGIGSQQKISAKFYLEQNFGKRTKFLRNKTKFLKNLVEYIIFEKLNKIF